MTPTAHEELDLCLHCGSPAVYDLARPLEIRSWYARCSDDSCRIRTRACLAAGDDDRAKSVVRRIWNRRADDERVAELAAALPPSGKLRALADWFDRHDKTGYPYDHNPPIAMDLRDWANAINAVTKDAQA